MSYAIIDSTGAAKDLATSQGIIDLEAIAGPKLEAFLETGEADEALAKEIVTEVKEDNRTAYIADLLSGTAPFVLSNGIEEDDEETGGAKYSDDQPRDESGRWADAGGGPSSGGLSDAEFETAKHTVFALTGNDIDPSHVDVVNEKPRTFTVGDKQFSEGGHFDPATGKIQINVWSVASEDDIRAIAVHEITHYKQDVVDKARDVEHDEILKMPPDEYNRYFQNNGYMRSEMETELYGRFPASAAYAKTIGDGFLASETAPGFDAMKKEDGVSNYSKAYWSPVAMRQNGSTIRATQETLAEVNRVIHNLPRDGDSQPSENWRNLNMEIARAYLKVKK